MDKTTAHPVFGNVTRKIISNTTNIAPFKSLIEQLSFQQANIGQMGRLVKATEKGTVSVFRHGNVEYVRIKSITRAGGEGFVIFFLLQDTESGTLKCLGITETAATVEIEYKTSWLHLLNQSGRTANPVTLIDYANNWKVLNVVEWSLAGGYFFDTPVSPIFKNSKCLKWDEYTYTEQSEPVGEYINTGDDMIGTSGWDLESTTSLYLNQTDENGQDTVNTGVEGNNHSYFLYSWTRIQTGGEPPDWYPSSYTWEEYKDDESISTTISACSIGQGKWAYCTKRAEETFSDVAIGSNDEWFDGEIFKIYFTETYSFNRSGLYECSPLMYGSITIRGGCTHTSSSSGSSASEYLKENAEVITNTDVHTGTSEETGEEQAVLASAGLGDTSAFVLAYSIRRFDRTSTTAPDGTVSWTGAVTETLMVAFSTSGSGNVVNVEVDSRSLENESSSTGIAHCTLTDQFLFSTFTIPVNIGGGVYRSRVKVLAVNRANGRYSVTEVFSESEGLQNAVIATAVKGFGQGAYTP